VSDRRRILGGSLLALAGCITPNVLDESHRAVPTAPAELAWVDARPEDLNGLFESVAIEGEAAASLWKVYYHFDAGGSFTGAALVLGEAGPEFQTLSGAWKLDANGLDLGDGATVRASAAGDRLRFESESGIAVLKRVAVE
jgi:hypothetical protein